MKSPITLIVLNKLISIIIHLSAMRGIISSSLKKIVFINEIVTCIIWGIDVYHLHLSQICLLEKLQCIQIIALDINIFGIRPSGCSIPANRLFPFKAQSFFNRSIRKDNRLPFIRPCKLIALLSIIHDLRIDLLHQNVFINGADNIAILVLRFRDCIREQSRKLLVIFFRNIWRMHLKLLHL